MFMTSYFIAFCMGLNDMQCDVLCNVLLLTSNFSTSYICSNWPTVKHGLDLMDCMDSAKLINDSWYFSILHTHFLESPYPSDTNNRCLHRLMHACYVITFNTFYKTDSTIWFPKTLSTFIINSQQIMWSVEAYPH